MNGFKNVPLNRKRGGITGFTVGAVFFLLVLIILNFFSGEIKNFFISASLPIEKTFWLAGESASSYFSSVLKSGALGGENFRLREENQKLLSQVVFLQGALRAMEAESTAYAVFQKNNFSFAMADVIGSDGDDELTVNKGSENGISEGMPVVSEQGVLYGKIAKVYKNFSFVLLISNRSSVVSAEILRDSQDSLNNAIEGVIRGAGGLEVFLDLVPVDERINKGDVLISSALEGTFPKDLLIGKIENVRKNDQNPHQQAEVSPFFNISVDNLFVITNYKRNE